MRTEARVTGTPLSRPQPVGILPVPAGLLVLPGEMSDDLVRECVGEETGLPDSWSFYCHARASEWALALEALRKLDGPVAEYNRFVLDPSQKRLDNLRTTLRGELRILLDVAAFNFGLMDDVADAAALDGELRALALMTEAAAAMERAAHADALGLLDRAVGEARAASPLFAAQLLGQMASLYKMQPEPGPLARKRRMDATIA
jgi:hypothetical protein